jgi:hypothetical protein
MKMIKMIFFKEIEGEDESTEIYFDKVDILGTTVFIPEDERCKDQLYHFLNSINENRYEEARENICLDEEYKIFFDLKYRVGKRATKIEIGVVQRGSHIIKKIQVVKMPNADVCDKVKKSLTYNIL